MKQWCKEAGEDVSYEFLQVGQLVCENLWLLGVDRKKRNK